MKEQTYRSRIAYGLMKLDHQGEAPKMNLSVTVRLNHEVHRILVEKARREDRSFSSWVRCALRRELKSAGISVVGDAARNSQ